MDVRARVAQNVRTLRVAAGISQENFAVDVGLDRTYVSRIERGLENPTVGVLGRIAKVLKVDVIALVSEPSSRARAPTLRPGRKRGKPA